MLSKLSPGTTSLSLLMPNEAIPFAEPQMKQHQVTW